MIKKGRNSGVGFVRVALGGVRPSDTGKKVRPSDTGKKVRPSDTGKKFVRVALGGVRPSDTGKRFRPSCTTGVCPSLYVLSRQ